MYIYRKYIYIYLYIYMYVYICSYVYIYRLDEALAKRLGAFMAAEQNTAKWLGECLRLGSRKQLLQERLPCGQSIVRRELSDNFCWYNQNYDSLKARSLSCSQAAVDVVSGDKLAS